MTISERMSALISLVQAAATSKAALVAENNALKAQLAEYADLEVVLSELEAEVAAL